MYMKCNFFIKYISLLAINLFLVHKSNAQLDSIAKTLSDTIISKLIVDDIPKKTFKDKFMYPHRWYVKQLLRKRTSDFDTTYIVNNKRKLTITIPISKKFYGINLNDLTTRRKLKFSPNNYYHVGFNFSNIILTFGFVPAIRFGAWPNRGNTKSIDIQLTLIGRRVITDINYQNYKGFYIRNTNEFSPYNTELDIIVRPDVNVVSYGVNTMFVYNHKKYSLRGAFSFTDVQRKSSASFMTGVYHSNIDFTSNDSSFVKHPFNNFFSPSLKTVNKISLLTIGVSGGYGYTYVYKKIIFSNALNIGFGGQKTKYETVDKSSHSLPLSLTSHVNAKVALRYDNSTFFTGMLATYDNDFSLISKQFTVENYISRVVLFFGYRFNIKQNGRKVLKAMGLVDYAKK